MSSDSDEDLKMAAEDYLSFGSESEESEIAENGPELEQILAELKIDASNSDLRRNSLQPSDEEDLAFCRAFFAGEDTAFIQLYAKYETPLLHYCRRVMPSDKLAEDAFQDSWIRFFELRAKGAEVTNFRALIFKIARNLCLNTKRLEFFRAGTSEELQSLKASDESSENLEKSEIKTLMTRALAKLPFDQREAFVLHEYSGYSYQEISDMIGIEMATIKVRAFRARIRLRKLIASWLGLAEDDDPTSVI